MNAPAPAFELAASALHAHHSPESAAARRYFAGDPEREAVLTRLELAAHSSRGRLSREAVRALYGERLRISASRADMLAKCRFADFLQNGLRARPRQPAVFAPPEMGTFMHFVLEGTAREIQEAGGFSAVDDAAVDSICDRCVERYIHERLYDFRQKSQRFIYLFRRLTKSVRAVVRDMVSELRAGDFVPLDFELDFGDRAAFPPIEMGYEGDAVTLTGVADRVDGWIRGDQLYLRIMDYKTGRRAFSLSDVWYGMGLQMLLYLFALQRSGSERYGKEIVPAGVLYVPARDVLVSAKTAMTAEEILAEKAKSLRRSGLVLADPEVLEAMERGKLPKFLPLRYNKEGEALGDALVSAERFGLLSRHIEKTLRSMAKELRSGSIAADPWFRSLQDNACLNCDFADACLFDESEDGFRYFERLKTAAVWERLEKEGDTADGL